MGKLWGLGVRIDADYSSAPYRGIAIVAKSGDMLTINAGPGKNVSVTFLGALVSFSGADRITNDGEHREVIAAFFAPFWEQPGKHETVSFLKAHEGATLRLL